MQLTHNALASIFAPMDNLSEMPACVISLLFLIETLALVHQPISRLALGLSTAIAHLDKLASSLYGIAALDMFFAEMAKLKHGSNVHPEHVS